MHNLYCLNCDSFYNQHLVSDVILNRAKDYYENDKKKGIKQKIIKEIYLKKIKIRNMEIENREYARNTYHNMSEEKKQRLKEYQKNYRETKKLK